MARHPVSMTQQIFPGPRTHNHGPPCLRRPERVSPESSLSSRPDRPTSTSLDPAARRTGMTTEGRRE